MTNTAQKSSTRLELLLFRLNQRQHFGINVLKVREILPCPQLTKIPHASPMVIGVAELRGQTIPIIDLAMAIGLNPVSAERNNEQKIILAEFSRTTQGFLVAGVDNIVIKDWRDVLPPPSGINNAFITGVIRMEKELVQVLDVEQVMHKVNRVEVDKPDNMQLDEAILARLQGRNVLVVDDSVVARNQTCRILDQLGVNHVTARDGKEALDMIKVLTQECDTATDCIPLVISDIEMPEMDGYQLSREIKGDPRYQKIYVLLHTSLDGKANTEQAANAGADSSLTKFIPELLTEEIIKGIKHVTN